MSTCQDVLVSMCDGLWIRECAFCSVVMSSGILSVDDGLVDFRGVVLIVKTG